VALFVPWRVSTRRAHLWLPRGLAGTAVLAAFTWGALTLIGVTRRNLVASCIALVAASLVWMPVTRRWNARAHLCWAATSLLFATYLAFMIWWTFVSHLGVAGTVGSLLLWFLEAWAALMGFAYLWELCNALGMVRWRRRVSERDLQEAAPVRPFVSLHVPAYNEPPEMVIETLRSLKALDYPNFEIIAIDDNSDDESLWRPVEAWCHENSVKFAHLDDWPGYKSGALNYALQHMTDPRAELIGVVDADYQIAPDFLIECSPLFADPDVAFIQAPQDYRDWRTTRSTAVSTTRTATSSRCPSPRETRAMAPSLPGRWGSSGDKPSRKWGVGTSGASLRTLNSRCGCFDGDIRDCMSSGPSAKGSCPSPSKP
jgi:hypothetical protein